MRTALLATDSAFAFQASQALLPAFRDMLDEDVISLPVENSAMKANELPSLTGLTSALPMAGLPATGVPTTGVAIDKLVPARSLPIHPLPVNPSAGRKLVVLITSARLELFPVRQGGPDVLFRDVRHEHLGRPAQTDDAALDPAEQIRRREPRRRRRGSHADPVVIQAIAQGSMPVLNGRGR